MSNEDPHLIYYLHTQLTWKKKILSQAYVHSIGQIPSSIHHQTLFQNNIVLLTRLNGQGCGLCIRVQLILRINNSNNIHVFG